MMLVEVMGYSSQLLNRQAVMWGKLAAGFVLMARLTPITAGTACQ